MLMRLAFCNATRRWGGVKTWTIEFAAALQERGHKVFVYGRPGPFIDRAREQGLEAYPVTFGFDYHPVTIARFWRDFRRHGIEAVLVNVGKDLRTAGIAARLLGIPVVQRVGLPGDMRDSFAVRLDKRILKQHYLCPCRYIRDGMLAELPFVKEAETSVVYSAKTPLAEPPRRVGRPLRIVSTSQVNANKGHFELADTLAALAREGLPFHWHVAGIGDCLDDLKHRVGALGIGAMTDFHGFTQNVGAILAEGDVFVLSSYTEGLPNTLLEGMAAGLVPVARAVGGVPECWPPRLGSFLVPYTGRCREGGGCMSAARTPVEELPLYGPLKTILTASDASITEWKAAAWRHVSEHFSLAVQASALERFFMARTARG